MLELFSDSFESCCHKVSTLQVTFFDSTVSQDSPFWATTSYLRLTLYGNDNEKRMCVDYSNFMDDT